MPQYSSYSLGPSIEAAEIAAGAVTNSKLGSDIDQGSEYIKIELDSNQTVIQGTWNFANAYTSHVKNPIAQNNTSPADGDELNYPVKLTAGTYKVIVGYAKKNSAGILKVLIDTDVVHTIDCYDVSGGWINDLESESGNFTITSTGTVTVKIKVDGKHGSSSSYNILSDLLIIYKVS